MVPSEYVLVQGCGNVGSWAAKLLHDRGGIIVGISDVNAAMVDDRPEGIDIPKLLRHLVINKGDIESYLKESKQGLKVKHDDLFDVKCDVWVPAAIGGIIDGVLLPNAVLANVSTRPSHCGMVSALL